MLFFQLLNNSEHLNQPKRKIPQGFLYGCFVSLLLLPVTLHKLPGNGEAWDTEPDSRNSLNCCSSNRRVKLDNFWVIRNNLGQMLKMNDPFSNYCSFPYSRSQKGQRQTTSPGICSPVWLFSKSWGKL